MTNFNYREANRRYRRVVIPAFLLYAALTLGGAFLFRMMEAPPLWASALIAVLSAAPVGVICWLMWRLLQETDEFTRMQQALAMAAGGLITAFACILWGFLELYDVLPSLEAFLLGPLFFLSYGLVYRFVMKRSCEPGFEQ